MPNFLDFSGLQKYHAKAIDWSQYTLTINKISNNNYSVLISEEDATRIRQTNHPLIVNLNWLSSSTTVTVSLSADTGATDPCTGNPSFTWIADLSIKSSDRKTFNTYDRGIIVKVGTNRWSLIT